MIALGSAAKLFQPGSHGSTFGGNPIAAASANATIGVIENQDLLSRNYLKGEWIKNEIGSIKGVREVRGSGFLLGIVLDLPVAKEIYQKLLIHKILVNAPNDEVIRIAPAYVVSDDQIREFINIFKEVLSS